MTAAWHNKNLLGSPAPPSMRNENYVPHLVPWNYKLYTSAKLKMYFILQETAIRSDYNLEPHFRSRRSWTPLLELLIYFFHFTFLFSWRQGRLCPICLWLHVTAFQRALTLSPLSLQLPMTRINDFHVHMEPCCHCTAAHQSGQSHINPQRMGFVVTLQWQILWTGFPSFQAFFLKV